MKVRDLREALSGKHDDAPVTIRQGDGHFTGSDATAAYAVGCGDGKGEFIIAASDATEREHAL